MNLDEVRRTYAAWAPYYDLTHAWTLPYRRKARLAMQVRSGDRALDLACGTGLNLSHLRELVGEAGYVTGVDLSPAMLEIARERIARHRWMNVRVDEADAAELPFENGSFDCAICTFALNIIPDARRAVDEVRRVMTPSGRFVVLDLGPKASMAPHGWPEPLKRWLDRVGHTCALDLGRDTLSVLRAGFEHVEVHELLFGVLYLAVGTDGRVRRSEEDRS